LVKTKADRTIIAAISIIRISDLLIKCFFIIAY